MSVGPTDNSGASGFPSAHPAKMSPSLDGKRMMVWSGGGWVTYYSADHIMEMLQRLETLVLEFLAKR